MTDRIELHPEVGPSRVTRHLRFSLVAQGNADKVLLIRGLWV
jgi:hypothetical protein